MLRRVIASVVLIIIGFTLGFSYLLWTDPKDRYFAYRWMVLLVLGLFARWFAPNGGFELRLAPSIGFLAAQARLIFSDVDRNPTSHNLFPFELLINLLFCLSAETFAHFLWRWLGRSPAR
jgi:hypothetical protein